MTCEYYPFSNITCHHFANDGGCNFCGYKYQKKSVSQANISIKEQISHFDNFILENIKDIKKHDRLVIAPNGSWFTQVPKELREHIYAFIKTENISFLKYESRATLFNMDAARKELSFTIFGDNLKSELLNLEKSLDEITSSHIVSLGLEVADDQDLKKLNKGTILEDYVNASNEIHKRGGSVCCNILVAPHLISDPIYKALYTARYAIETLGAKELVIMPCIPMKHTKGYELWKSGEWNPINATAASEIFRIIREKNSSTKIQFRDLRVYSFTNRYGLYFRENRRWTDEDKLLERKMVRDIAKEVY